MNFLEQLAAEWYEFTGYFVRSNVRAKKRVMGGWDAELDVLAYKPSIGALIHAELSGDADSWTQRRTRFMGKKFIFDDAEYSDIVGASVSSVRRVAVVGFSRSAKVSFEWGKGVEVVLIPQFLRLIADDLSKREPAKEAVPEGFPLLRAIQFTLAFGGVGVGATPNVSEPVSVIVERIQRSDT